MEKSSKTDKKKEFIFPLGKINMILMACCLLLIVVGFWLMTGSANEGSDFNYAIFESRRTTIGPMIALAGFVLMAPAILYRRKENTDDNDEQQKA